MALKYMALLATSHPRWHDTIATMATLFLIYTFDIPIVLVTTCSLRNNEIASGKVKS